DAQDVRVALAVAAGAARPKPDPASFEASTTRVASPGMRAIRCSVSKDAGSGFGRAAPAATAWNFKDLDFLLADVHAMIRAKEAGASIIYVILLFLAMLAILDTQLLSIFYRKKEIGTMMALGLTRGSVIRLFTLE